MPCDLEVASESQHAIGKNNSSYITNYLHYIVLQVGDKYALENEDELKDKMNFEEHPSYKLPTGTVNF